MKPKTIVLIIIILAAMGGGLYLFQKDKQKKALVEHNKKKFQEITKVAKKSGPAGLLNMALAINKFHQVKGHYPDDLYKLYPEFIPDKSFISTLEWEYNLKNGSYLLKKSIAGEKTFASMGPNLKLKTGQLSSSDERKIVATAIQPKKRQDTSKKAITSKGPSTGSDIKKKTKTSQEVKTSSLARKTTTGSKKPESMRKNSKSDSTIRILKKTLNENEKFLLSFTNSGLYIWKTKDGIIGFSNIQYPERKGLIMFKDQGWVQYIDEKIKIE